jgi:hypothetical protein
MTTMNESVQTIFITRRPVGVREAPAVRIELSCKTTSAHRHGHHQRKHCLTALMLTAPIAWPVDGGRITGCDLFDDAGVEPDCRRWSRE